MDAATEDSRGYHSQAESDPHFFRDPQMFTSDEEVGFPNQMGSGRRDARVVCETFSSGRHFSPASPKRRRSGPQKGSKASSRRRSLAFSRNPLLACFVGESVLSSRAMHLSPNCDSGSQTTFFSLIPVDRSRVNESTGEPQSPQLSCIGQVKHRQAKVAKLSEAVAEDLARMDINDGIIPHSLRISKATSGAGIPKDASFKLQKEESFRLQKESFRLQKEGSFKMQIEESFNLHKVESFKLRKEESFKVQKEESFKRQKEESFKLHREVVFKLQRKERPVDVAFDAIPHLDLGGENLSVINNIPHLDQCDGKNVARLMRSRRGGDEEKKVEDDEKVSSPSQRNSIRHLNHFLKQKLGASMVRSGFVCGWTSGEASPRSPKSESEPEHCEIDLSRFASGDLQLKTPCFKDSKALQHIMGKKLANIRVHSQQTEGIDRKSWKEETQGIEQTSGKDETQGVDGKSWKDEMQGKQRNDVCISALSEGAVDPAAAIVIRSSPSTVILQPANEAALWKRRCMPRPQSLEV